MTRALWLAKVVEVDEVVADPLQRRLHVPAGHLLRQHRPDGMLDRMRNRQADDLAVGALQPLADAFEAFHFFGKRWHGWGFRFSHTGQGTRRGALMRRERHAPSKVGG